MTVALLITFFYAIAIYLVFFRFQLLKFNIVWGVVSFWVGFHLLLIFVVALRFFTPYSIDGHVIRQTVQLVPRLPEPTLIEEVLVAQNTPVKKGQALYQFDRTVYELRLKEQEADLALARQNALALDQDVILAQDQLDAARATQVLAEEEVKRYTALVPQGGAKQETLDKWIEQLAVATAQVDEAGANVKKAELARDAKVDGVNAQVAKAQAMVDQAKYFLGQTTLRAPEDGIIVSQQARPGLVVGGRRIGAIAVLIADANPYLLAGFYQEHLKFVEEGQPVEVALDIYPGQIFEGKVKAIWEGTGQGQIKPSGNVPTFRFPQLQGRFAVEIVLDENPALKRFPAGAHGAVAIYTGSGSSGFEVLRRINIRLYSWMNFLFPLDI